MRFPSAAADAPALSVLLAPLVVGCLCTLVWAQEGEDSDLHGRQQRLGEEPSEASWLLRSLLSAARLGERLGQAGVMPSAVLVWDGSVPFAGAERERWTGRALLDLSLEIDLEQAAGLEGFSAFAEVYAQRGRDGSLDVGDVQAFSNIDGPNVTQLAELWVERTAPDRSWRVKLGKHDANGEFAFVHAGLDFLHSSAGYSPTIFTMPTYPDPAVGLDAFVRSAGGWRLGAGVFDAAPSGVVSGRRDLVPELDETFWIGELRRSWGGNEERRTGRLALGAWHHTGTFERAAGGTEDGTGGLFAILEHRLTPPAAERDGRGLVGFLQWGLADGAVSPVERHVGAGLAYTYPGREGAGGARWRTGIYASRAELGDAEGGEETAIELMQEIPLTGLVVLKPDLQLILDPGGDRAAEDVWVATLRVELRL